MIELILFLSLGLLIIVLYESRERYRARHPEKYPPAENISVQEDIKKDGCEQEQESCSGCALIDSCAPKSKAAKNPFRSSNVDRH